MNFLTRPDDGGTGAKPDSGAVVAPKLELRIADLARERPPSVLDDVHFPEALAAFVIENFSSRGDRVLDPFAGYGTTLIAARRLGRVAIGVKLLSSRVKVVRDRLVDPSWVIEADARELDNLDIGDFDLCLTSPPYMNAIDHPQNPLTGYQTTDGSYTRYLSQMHDVFAAVARRLRPGGVVVLNAANIYAGDSVTPLAEDLAAGAQRFLSHVRTIPIEWDTKPPLLVDDRLMIFRRPGRGASDS